jgi:hypothetical protein
LPLNKVGFGMTIRVCSNRQSFYKIKSLLPP